MDSIYTISELCDLLSVTRPIVEKRLRKMGFDTDNVQVYKTINNREIKAFKLSGQQKKEIGILNVNEAHIETPINTHTEQVKYAPNIDELVLKILDFSDRYNTDMKSYIDRVINAESQLKLLEDKSRDLEYWKLESIKAQQENVKINTKYELLENRLNELNSLENNFLNLKIDNKSLEEKNIKLESEKNKLYIQIKTLQEENERFKQQLEQERNKPFWKKKVL